LGALYTTPPHNGDSNYARFTMTLHSTLSGLRAATAFPVCLLGAPAALARAMPPPDNPDPDGKAQQEGASK